MVYRTMTHVAYLILSASAAVRAASDSNCLQTGAELAAYPEPGSASMWGIETHGEPEDIADSFVRQEPCGGAAPVSALPDQSQQIYDGKTVQVLSASSMTCVVCLRGRTHPFADMNIHSPGSALCFPSNCLLCFFALYGVFFLGPVWSIY
jgi:hypothetical protein